MSKEHIYMHHGRGKGKSYWMNKWAWENDATIINVDANGEVTISEPAEFEIIQPKQIDNGTDKQIL